MTDVPMEPPLRENSNLKMLAPDPIEPGTGTGGTLQASPGRANESRAGLVLFLGLLSLFMCGPVGLIAWIMANADLRKIREGTLSPRNSGTLKLGKVLGIVGTLIFVLGIVCVAVLLQRGLPTLEGLMRTQPLPPDQVAFAGEWFGNKGTYIAIRPNGSGDYKSRHSTVTGGRVFIDKESLAIGLMGFSKTWHIESPPHMEDGNWSMKLDGEVFLRKTEGLAV